MTYRVFGGQTYTLQSAISSTQTTINLSSFTVPVTNTPITMSLLGTDIVYATIDPKTSNSEFISFTGITQNGDGTAQLTGVTRGLNKTYPYTSDVSFKLPHSGAAQLIISNPPQLYNKLAVLENDNTFTATNNFTGVIKVPTYTSSDIDHAASIEYVNDVAIAGAPDASSTVKGISKLSTNPVSPTNPIAVGDNDTRVPPVNTSTMTAGQIQALAGTAGIPSSSNKYVTQAGLNTPFGDGSDGNLHVTSTTTLDLSIKTTWNYVDVTIDNGATLTFTGGTAGDKIPVLKLTGNFVNNGGTIITKGLGASGGIGGAAGGSSSPSVGSNGTSGTQETILYPDLTKPGAGVFGTSGSTTANGTVTNGTGGALGNKNATYFIAYGINGSGGAGGGGGAQGYQNTSPIGTPGAGGNGGAGGLGLIIQVKGTYTNTGTFNLSGNNGVAGTDGTGNGSVVYSSGPGGGGGGGGAGSLFILYGSTITDSGTYILSGGTGGIGGIRTNIGGSGGTLTQGASGGGGGGGASAFNSGTTGENGTLNNNPGAGAGGNGGDGYKFIQKVNL